MGHLTSEQKGSAAIWQHLDSVLQRYVQSNHPDVSVIHFFSDGPCTRYRQRGNFFLLFSELSNRSFQVHEISLRPAKGEAAPDGVGVGLLKRQADLLVSQCRDLPHEWTLYQALLKTSACTRSCSFDGTQRQSWQTSQPACHLLPER